MRAYWRDWMLSTWCRVHMQLCTLKSNEYGKVIMEKLERKSCGQSWRRTPICIIVFEVLQVYYFEDVTCVKFMYLVSTHVPVDSYHIGSSSRCCCSTCWVCTREVCQAQLTPTVDSINSLIQSDRYPFLTFFRTRLGHKRSGGAESDV